jgi:hypothetical protein
MGFGLVIGFTEHLQIITTSNYSAFVNSHTLQFTTERIKSSQSAVSSLAVTWQRLQTPQLSQLHCSCPYWLVTVSQPTPRLAAISHQLPTLLTATQRLLVIAAAPHSIASEWIAHRPLPTVPLLRYHMAITETT